MPGFRVFSTIAMLCLFLAGCVVTPSPGMADAPVDSSVASSLFRAEEAYRTSRSENDAIGMAEAVRDRMTVLDAMEISSRIHPGVREAFLASTRIMMDETREMAADEAEILAEIERMFAMENPAEEGVFSGLFGKGVVRSLRKVDVTVGMEMDIFLSPGMTEELRLPVVKDAGTTIFVEPSREFAGFVPDLVLSVLPVVAPGETAAEGCETISDGGRLACFVPAGAHTEIDLVITNRSDSRVSVVVFVSGDARSVGTALASE
ncbi:hypothetical protein CW354_08160 [Marinicaulis flavus]|uniref:Uncharacterized protein n=2 Tax=Hyphococcus luteus TaxID=2058213 RepID=A0A2S7K6X0_9PROT|nr:hypothetical protein CW354_08160 [Marinicaulis flavus]